MSKKSLLFNFIDLKKKNHPDEMKQDVRMEMTGHLMTSSLSDPNIKRHLHANILREASTNQIERHTDDVLTNGTSRRTSPILCVKPTDVVRPSSEIDVVDPVDSNNNVVLSVDKVTYNAKCPDSEVVVCNKKNFT